jgi:hypothetical protein
MVPPLTTDQCASAQPPVVPTTIVYWEPKTRRMVLPITTNRIAVAPWVDNALHHRQPPLRLKAEGATMALLTATEVWTMPTKHRRLGTESR